MTLNRHRRTGHVWALSSMIALLPARAIADEIWVAPTSQQDVGGLEIASNGLWPVTPVGAVRLAWAIPDDLQTFQGAKLVLIPHAPGGAANVNVYVCPAQQASVATAGCAGPFATAFTGVANKLAEVDISAALAPRIGTPGANYLAVIAYTTPTTATDHIVGLRFAYAPTPPSGSVAGTANTVLGAGNLSSNTTGERNTALGNNTADGEHDGGGEHGSGRRVADVQSKPIQYGLVGEEVAEAFPELAVRNAQGEVETVHYETLSVLLLNEVQRQERQNEDQQRQIEELKAQVAELLARAR